MVLAGCSRVQSSQPLFIKEDFFKNLSVLLTKILVEYHGVSVVQSNCEVTQLGKIKNLGKMVPDPT